MHGVIDEVILIIDVLHSNMYSPPSLLLQTEATPLSTVTPEFVNEIAQHKVMLGYFLGELVMAGFDHVLP